MIDLRQSTASQEVPLGYFVDSTDGNTEKTALTIANTDIKIWKNGATTLADKNSGGATHVSNGIYYAVFDATDTDTLGPMVIHVHVAGALTVRQVCNVLSAAQYDFKYGTVAPAVPGSAMLITAGTGSGQLDVASGVIKSNLTQILGTTLTETAGQIAGAFKKWFDVATPTGTVNSLPDAVPGASGGVFVAGTNAATVVTGSLTTTFTGNLTGSVASVTARVTANTDQLAGQAVTAAAGVTFPTSVASPTNITAATGIVLASGTHTGAVIPTVTSVTNRVLADSDMLGGQIVTAFDAITIPGELASPTNITAATGIVLASGTHTGAVIPTVTNLTNAPSSGDFTATMKTSLNAATPSVTISDKTGFSLSPAGIQAIWDALTSALTTLGSVGKLLVDNINATVSSRLATLGATAPAGWVDAAAIAAGALNGKGDWNVGKTGYSLTVAYDAAKTAAQAGDAMAVTGDFSATMKTSLNAATPASVTGAVGSVTAAVTVTGDFSATMKTSIATAVSAIDIDGYTLQNANKLMFAAMTGTTSGSGTTTNIYYAPDGLTARITGTIDASRNRTAVVLTP